MILFAVILAMGLVPLAFYAAGEVKRRRSKHRMKRRL